MVSSALFSSNSDEWETPQDLFDKLNIEFHFNIDLAASAPFPSMVVIFKGLSYDSD